MDLRLPALTPARRRPGPEHRSGRGSVLTTSASSTPGLPTRVARRPPGDLASGRDYSCGRLDQGPRGQQQELSRQGRGALICPSVGPPIAGTGKASANGCEAKVTGGRITTGPGPRPLWSLRRHGRPATRGRPRQPRVSHAPVRLFPETGPQDPLGLRKPVCWKQFGPRRGARLWVPERCF